MKYLLMTALLAASLSACATPSPDQRVDLVLRNSTPDTIILHARMGFLGKNLTLAPGETWYGWVPRSFVGREIKIEVRKAKKKKPAR